MKVEVVAILPGSLALVDTRGFRRVVVDGEHPEELLDPDEAEHFASALNEVEGKRVARVVRYRAAPRRLAQ